MESCACAQKPMNSSVKARNARRAQTKRGAEAVSRFCANSAAVSSASASAMTAHVERAVAPDAERAPGLFRRRQDQEIARRRVGEGEIVRELLRQDLALLAGVAQLQGRRSRRVPAALRADDEHGEIARRGLRDRLAPGEIADFHRRAGLGERQPRRHRAFDVVLILERIAAGRNNQQRAAAVEIGDQLVVTPCRRADCGRASARRVPPT